MKMDEDMILVVNFENICRLCLQSTGAMTNIFTSTGEKSLQQQILCITGLATEEGDGLPSKICHRCRHVVEQASELRDVVDKSRKILARAVLDKVEKSSDAEPFDNETFLQSLSDPNTDAETITIEKYENDQDDLLEEESATEEYNFNDSNIATIIPDDQFRELNSKCITEDGGMKYNTEDPAIVPRRKNNNQRPPRDLTCQICLVLFASTEEVRPHVEQHYIGSDLQIYLDIKSRPLMCTFCNEVQLNMPQLVKHHRKHLGVNPYECKVPGCKYVGKDRDGLRHHRAVHAARTRVCTTCGASFRRRSDLVSHAARLHPAAPRARLSALACGTCGLRTASQLALRSHMSAHHFVPKFPCPYGSCERSYPSERALRDHEHAHRGRRRYRCRLCSADHFLSSGRLSQHMKAHELSRSRMLTCAKCPTTFEQHAAYYRHWLAHHGRWEPHRCRACNQGYPAESQLQNHEKTCERLKNLLSIITEHTNGRTNARERADNDDQSQDELNGETEEFYEMDQNSETDYEE